MAYEMFKVLLVDDDPIVIKLYDKLLRDNHYQVIVAQNGQEALDKAFHESPDIVLLDIMMPKLNGYEVCARLRAAPRTADLPIIILTAMTGTAARQKASDMGADDFVTKGEPMHGIEGRIKMLLKRRIDAHTKSWLADLPGSISAEYVLRSHLEAGLALAACYLDLKDLSTFCQYAGFQEGDRILWKLARILQSHIRDANQGDFVGHTGADHFILLTTPEHAEPLADLVIESFDAAMREWGGSAPTQEIFPRLSMAIVIVQNNRAIHPRQVYDTARSLLQEARNDRAHTIRIAHIP
ncbi:MAG: response regulator [Anaerolineae bacterium]|nr:response regulator [Anaerolineae bacterium]